MKDEAKVLCKTRTPNKKGTRILKWKYNLIRSAILTVIPQDEFGIPFQDLPRLVKGMLNEEDLERLASLRWYTTTVKLDLEVRGGIERIPRVKRSV